MTALAGRNVAFVVNARVVLRVGVFHRADAIRLDAGRAAPPAAGLPRADRHRRSRRRDCATSASDSHVAALMFVKAGWGLAGGVLLLLTIFGQRVFPLGGGIGGRHRRALRRARRRRRARADRAALDHRTAAAAAAPGDRAGVLHGRRVLRRARRRADAVARGAVRAAARTSAARSSGCSARCCCSSRCPIAFAAASSPRSSRS